ncbi:MAG: NAD-dependent epimerase/dehydratase family protein [Alphaproteobacteria bacterium]|nr:NAD-dependent epimerase/dehydratase family protein [Alphaproteobacteria bacterium]MCB9795675.1 NAD-dependent epimerase/dehydratase family protein [Alphaproteobacteria bacterium]
MKVLVTGGTGFIGANVVRHLLARGDEVVCLTRGSSPTLCLDGLDVQRVQGDLSDAEALKPLLDGVEGVYHLAGVFDPSPKGRALMFRVHVDGTRALCEAAVAAGVRRLVLCSSSVTVGFGPRHAPGNEDTPIHGLDRLYGADGPLRWYHDSKLRSEQLVREYIPRGLEAVIVNPDYIIGAWDIKPTSGALVLTMCRSWIPVYPQGGKCFQDADDCALGHLYAMDRGQAGRRYLLGNENHSYREFMGIIAKVTGQRPPALPMPRLLAEAAGLAGAIGSRVDAHRFAGLNRYVLRSMAQGRYRSGRRAVQELGVPQTSLEVAVEKCVRWFRDHGYCD